MKSPRIVRVVAIVAVAAAFCVEAAAVHAQDWPARPIRIVIPYPPGGYTDYNARTIGQKLSESLAQPFIFENRPGANSVIGADAVAKAPADGYTFGVIIAAHAVNATLHPKLPYDVFRDFTYVSLISVAPLIMCAHPSVPANSVQELIALAKAKPGELNFASSGIGAAAHLTMELFKARVGVNMVHVPYKGTSPALTDLIGGRVNAMFDTVGALMPHVRAGTIKALVVTARERMPAAPEVPTMAESGMRDFVSGTWAGLIAPAGVPKPIVERLAAQVAKSVREPEMRERFARDGYDGIGSSPAEFAAFMHDEVARWAKVITDAGIKPQE
jgi:tripartite-type tricarboxylate transporter receptor subunit TctC